MKSKHPNVLICPTEDYKTKEISKDFTPQKKIEAKIQISENVGILKRKKKELDKKRRKRRKKTRTRRKKGKSRRKKKSKSRRRKRKRKSKKRKTKKKKSKMFRSNQKNTEFSTVNDVLTKQ